jgi:hypothetical protein
MSRATSAKKARMTGKKRKEFTFCGTEATSGKWHQAFHSNSAMNCILIEHDEIAFPDVERDQQRKAIKIP